MPDLHKLNPYKLNLLDRNTKIQKLDSPSGTAIALAKEIEKAIEPLYKYH